MGGTMGPPVMRAIPQPTGGSSARGGACGRRRGPPPRGCTAPQPTAAKPILESIFLGPQTIDGPPAMTRACPGDLGDPRARVVEIPQNRQVSKPLRSYGVHRLEETAKFLGFEVVGGPFGMALEGHAEKLLVAGFVIDVPE